MEENNSKKFNSAKEIIDYIKNSTSNSEDMVYKEWKVMEKEEMIKIRDIFKKSTDILNEVINLFEELDKTNDEIEQKNIQDKIEEKTGLFAMQMFKIQNL